MYFTPAFADHLVFYQHPYLRHALGSPSRRCANFHCDPEQSTNTQKDDKTNESTTERTLVFRGCNVQIAQSKDNYHLTLDLPGVREGDLTVEYLDGGILKVNAERKSRGQAITKQFALDEAEVEKDKMAATFQDGVLDVTIPRKEPVAVEPTSITVTPKSFEEEDEDSTTKTVASIDIPGVPAKDVRITFHNDRLLIQAQRRRGDYVSAIRRAIPVDSKQVEASELRAFLADGVLTVVAPERQESAPVRIAVNSTGAQENDKEASEQENDAAVVSAETVSDDEAAEDEEAASSSQASDASVPVEGAKDKESDEWEQVDDDDQTTKN